MYKRQPPAFTTAQAIQIAEQNGMKERTFQRFLNDNIGLLFRKEKHLSLIHIWLSLHTHPFVAAYLTKGLVSPRLGWWFKYKRWIRIVPRDAYRYLQYRFYDRDGKVIKM